MVLGVLATVDMYISKINQCAKFKDIFHYKLVQKYTHTLNNAEENTFRII